MVKSRINPSQFTTEEAVSGAPFYRRGSRSGSPPCHPVPTSSCQQLGQDAAMAVPVHWTWHEGNRVISALWNVSLLNNYSGIHLLVLVSRKEKLSESGISNVSRLVAGKHLILSITCPKGLESPKSLLARKSRKSPASTQCNTLAV